MTSQSSLVAHMERPSPSNVFLADESEKLVEASKKGNLIPLSRSIFSDHLTPVLAYRCLVKEDDRDAPSFLFESVEPGSNDSNVENMVTIMDHREGCRTEEIVEDPMTVPRRIMEGWTPQLLDELPEAFSGSIGFNTQLFGTKLEDSSLTSEEYKEAVLEAKEHILAGDIFQIVLSQHFERRTFADPFEIYRALRIVNPSPYMTYLQARGCILVASSPEILTRVKKKTITNRPLAGTVRRGKTPKEDLMLEKLLLNDEKQCAEHIMLVDLGRNDVGKVSKPGSVKVEELMNIERYSHVMHISSTVTISFRVTGELLDDLTSWDVLRTALPVGTVSGALKVKAMELIDKLEVTRRGPYDGGFGGISFSGNMDIALALRTIVFPTSFRYDTMYSYKDANKRREWVAHLQAGAGIVADSDPADEQRECENKAAALARAIDLAESSFVDN
ncbi:anthranilate synthase alpha subunit 2, chloroplastic-like isoform X1 [Malus domestica]|uniref:anthranilate synthase alpha subunit 2, chloroplastic-like isoform X1 n=1 Tax=Malus domestica TaxID=3750 RepID=UPI003974BDC1